jgi:hypothetical protein
MKARLSPGELRAAVLDACRRSIATGVIPTKTVLARAVPGYSDVTLLGVRRRLQDEGAIGWSHLGVSNLSRHGLPCRNEADVKIIRERARLVRLGIDPDTGRALPAPRPDRPSPPLHRP